MAGILIVACAAPGQAPGPSGSGPSGAGLYSPDPNASGMPSGDATVPTTSPAPLATALLSPCLGPSPASGSSGARSNATASPAPSPLDQGALFHVPILTYHVIAPRSVAAPYSLPGLDLSPELFDAQLQALERDGWHAITVDELAGDVASATAPLPGTFVISVDDGHSDGALYALPILRRHGFVATFYVVAGRIGDPDDLTWDQVGELAEAGMEIGNHTLHHVRLTTLTPAELRSEIDGAQALFAARLCRAPTTFAYPFGDFNSAVVGAVLDANFRMAVTTVHGASQSWGGRLEVPRISVYSTLAPDALLARIDPFR